MADVGQLDRAEAEGLEQLRVEPDRGRERLLGFLVPLGEGEGEPARRMSFR
ncbi:MAG: hypothetical protein ACREMF_00030 [Gemmatimonadales bacterium]